MVDAETIESKHIEPAKQIAALIAYDGTDYLGFQYQVQGRTIQGTLESTLTRFCKFEGRVAGAGRTDTGVHASGQVIGVHVYWKHDLAAFQRAWNVHLPDSIVVKSVCWVENTFHPRFRALWRTYRYYILVNSRVSSQPQRRSPLTDRTSHFEPLPLDVEAMNRASKTLIGIHDFATFGQPTQRESTIREVVAAQWDEFDVRGLPGVDKQQRKLVFTITASGFLHHMVRNLVGTLLEVGKGRIAVEGVAELLAAKAREKSAPPAPACGLVLEEIIYPAECGVTF